MSVAASATSLHALLGCFTTILLTRPNRLALLSMRRTCAANQAPGQTRLCRMPHSLEDLRLCEECMLDFFKRCAREALTKIGLDCFPETVTRPLDPQVGTRPEVPHVVWKWGRSPMTPRGSWSTAMTFLLRTRARKSGLVRHRSVDRISGADQTLNELRLRV